MDDLSNFLPSNLLYTEEEMRRYKHGGFDPVSLDDTFKDGRYQVRHKLGWGGFSTVWLTRDPCVCLKSTILITSHPDHRKFRLKKWVSLKILGADIPKPSRELQILQDLRQKRAAHQIVQLLDSFVHQGPNGSNQCLIFELLGPSVDFIADDYHMDSDRLDPAIILRIVRQLLKAVASIHAAGYAHGGLFWQPLPI